MFPDVCYDVGEGFVGLRRREVSRWWVSGDTWVQACECGKESAHPDFELLLLQQGGVANRI